MIRWGKDKELGNVVVDRNRGLQTLIDEFADKRIPLQGTMDDWAPYYKHYSTLYRLNEPDSLGVPTMVWESSDGNDHYCHATLYWRVGMDRFKNDGGKIFGDTEMFKLGNVVIGEKMKWSAKFDVPDTDYELL